MPRKLKRYHGRGDLHFITFSCYERRALLGTVRARDLFLKILEQVGRRCATSVVVKVEPMGEERQREDNLRTAEREEPTLCKNRKGWGTLVSEVREVNHLPCLFVGQPPDHFRSRVRAT